LRRAFSVLDYVRTFGENVHLADQPGANAYMKKIRLYWWTGIEQHPEKGQRGIGAWLDDTPENRKDLEILLECGNESFGEGTHHIEERDDANPQ
jgi:hypothetical protein